MLMGFEAIEHLCYCVSITKHVLPNIHILIELLSHKTTLAIKTSPQCMSPFMH